ncbi:MAG: hypothetical protein FJ298_07780 [Planctomycetes bacterium]|nr:hypothetical protein [Planctomycetota bacterium]
MRSRSPSLRFSRRGVSLLTILISLALVAAMAMVAIPAYFRSPDVTLEALVRLLDRDVRALQNRAAFAHAPALLRFSSDGWQAVDLEGRPLCALGDQHTIARSFERDGVFEGLTFERVELGPDAALTLDERGLVKDGGKLFARFGDGWRQIEIEVGAGHLVVTQPAPR